MKIVHEWHVCMGQGGNFGSIRGIMIGTGMEDRSSGMWFKKMMMQIGDWSFVDGNGMNYYPLNFSLYPFI